jgi:hypothetical protein
MTKQQYNYEYLQQFCEENNIKLTKDYTQERVNRDTQIEGNCKTESCDEMFCKNFRQLTRSGGFCKLCTGEICKQTNLKKFGCEYPSQSEEVKDKIKQTNLKKFGCEYPSQSEEVKKKMKQTCLKNHGVENPMQNEEVREKGEQTCLKNYGVKNPSQSEEVRKKGKQTCLQKYGVEYSLQSEEVKEKGKQTCLQKYGVEYSLQSEEVKEKGKQTCLKNHGVEHSMQSEEVKEKGKQTCFKNWGVDYPFQSEEVKEKGKQTCLQKYGVEHSMQNAVISDKASKNTYKSKEYILPSGSSIKIQGYEKFMLDELLQNIIEDDIITRRNQVPEIWYLDSSAKKHRYYVDVFIPSQNRMIECKSTWTMKKGIEKDNVYLKQQSCKDAGYLCEIWVYNAKGEKVECIL